MNGWNHIYGDKQTDYIFIEVLKSEDDKVVELQ